MRYSADKEKEGDKKKERNTTITINNVLRWKRKTFMKRKKKERKKKIFCWKRKTLRKKKNTTVTINHFYTIFLLLDLFQAVNQFDNLQPQSN